MLRFLIMAALALAAVPPAPARAQAPPRELTLDLRPWSADAAIAWRVGSAHMLGFSVGAGPDDLNHTFVPDVSPTSSEFVTLEQIVRLGPFYRYQSAGRFNVDIGLRIALGGVRGISGSPGLVTGVHTGVFAGGRHVRVGPRLFVGVAREGSDTNNVVHVEWLTARLRLPF